MGGLARSVPTASKSQGWRLAAGARSADHRSWASWLAAAGEDRRRRISIAIERDALTVMLHLIADAGHTA